MPENLKNPWSEDGRHLENATKYFPWTNKHPRDLRNFCYEVHAHNVKAGWWDGYEENKIGRVDTCMSLVLSELSEALEADRKSLGPCKHLPEYDSFATELADALIRLLDVAYAMNLKSQMNFQDHEDRINRAAHFADDKPVPAQLFAIAKPVTQYDPVAAIVEIIALAQYHGIPVLDIAVEKHAYNKVRADHKKEAREAEGGKKY